jgi:DNA polymerase (family 10)
MLGHPPGRLLQTRVGFEIDIDTVLDAASRRGTLIEINANPHRLDLDATACRKAKRLGIPLVINPDAHSTAGISDLYYGIGVARRAGLIDKDVFNAAPYKVVAKRLEALRSRT